MRREKKREIKNLLRQATERAHGGGPPAPSARPAPRAAKPVPQVFEMACMCGRILRLSEAVDEKRCACPSCKRKFEATFPLDPDTGKKSLIPMFIDDGMTMGDTVVADLPDIQTHAKGKGVFDDTLDPSPPTQMIFPCPSCNRSMMAKQETYDKRVRCPDCGMRMLINVIYDPVRKVHEVHPVRVDDQPTGDTWLLDR